MAVSDQWDESPGLKCVDEDDTAWLKSPSWCSLYAAVLLVAVSDVGNSQGRTGHEYSAGGRLAVAIHPVVDGSP